MEIETRDLNMEGKMVMNRQSLWTRLLGLTRLPFLLRKREKFDELTRRTLK